MRSTDGPLVAFALIFAAGWAEARGDLAYLRNGSVVPVTEIRSEAGRIVLVMPGGSQMTLPSDQLLAIRSEPIPNPPAGTPPFVPAPITDQGTPELAMGLPANPDRPIRLEPGEVFDGQALRELARRIARHHAVDEGLVQAVIEVESRYDAFAVSPRGAMGLMQLMPKTAQRFAVTNPFDPIQNIDCGVRYLKELLGRYEGRIPLALAAYNAGEDAVDRHRGIPPYRETRQYVTRIQRILSR